MNRILFYKIKNPYGYMSNFSGHSVFYNGTLWKTSEHAFQAMKYYPFDMGRTNLIKNVETPMEAAFLGRDRQFAIREDWEDAPNPYLIRSISYCDHVNDGLNGSTEMIFARLKDVAMYNIVFCKFMQNTNILKELLGTGDSVLIEDTTKDKYWGWGSDHNGQNKLGRILMMVRDKVRRLTTFGSYGLPKEG